MSSSPFAQCAQEVRQLHAALDELASACRLLQVAPREGREWHELLIRKLLPQLQSEPFIVAAVVGGTNIGKSVVFNHLAGCRASATSPHASGTKHPVCLVPPGFEQRHDLQEIFAGFELHAWTDADAPLENHSEHRLYWRHHAELPGNLLVLDTPDIDSDAPVNWLRADRVRHCADILVAVLTQQKYNDAAVKQFFRKAAEEEKATMVVFNQCLLPEDEEYWPMWLATFSRETGVIPDLLYVAPADRRAAEQNRLPFFARRWSAETGTVLPAGDVAAEATAGASGEPGGADESSRNLAVDLSEMHFSEIKMRTLRGSLLHLISPLHGVPTYLVEIENQSAGFTDAARLLSMQHLARIDNWPTPPSHLLVAEIRQWWRSQREGWTRTVHDAYGTLGEGLKWPFRWAWNRWQGAPDDPVESYLRQEWDVILQAVEALYGELSRLSQLGNDLLRPRLERIVDGDSRRDLLRRLAEAHASWNLQDDLERVVQTQMQSFRADNPNVFAWLKRLDSMAAAARPVTSVVLFAAAAGPAGHALVPFVTDAAAQSLAVHVIGDVAGGTGAVVVGETAMSGAAGGLRMVETHYRQLQSALIARRVGAFAEFLKEHLLGGLQQELETGSQMPQSEAFVRVQRILARLEQQLE